MAMTVTLAFGNRGSQNSVVGQPVDVVATVANSGAAAVTLQSLSVSVVNIGTRGPAGVTIDQPLILPPNQPIGTFPVIAAGASVNYPFLLVFQTPYSPGPSPQNPGGAAPFPGAWPANPVYMVTATGQSSDGSVFSGTLAVDLLTAIAPFPQAQGGAFQFGQGFNAINFITAFA